MKKNIFFLILFLTLCGFGRFDARAQGGNTTAELFQVKCGVCHTIGQGRLVGPDLAGVQDRRSQEWLMEFIRSSQTMINKGDPQAKALFEEYNQVIMPDPMISDGEIQALLQYITENSTGGVGAAAYQSILANAGPEEVERGRRLFDGRISFANGGASCIACHNGLTQTFFNDNSYAKDLSASFSTLGEQGVRAILENPPFPVMAQAFNQNPLNADEVRDLLAFLKSADKGVAATAAARPLGSGFFLYGLLGAFGLIVVYSGLWYGRKTRSVNHGIYKRQIKSLN
jgi:mono/diheme cytochrome c family protein